MAKILILGAGFGGLQAALGLEKNWRGPGRLEIILADRHDYHLFSPNLYAAAATEEELVSVSQVKKSLALPLRQILRGRRIQFVRGEIGLLDQAAQTVQVGGRRLAYDYAVLALGSRSDDFGIPGAAAYGLTLKSLPDALRIRQQAEFIFQRQGMSFSKKPLRLLIAGGGYTGLELACELKELADILCWKYNYPREKMGVMVVEAAGQLVPGFDERLSRDAFWRLRELGIEVRLSARIAAVEQNFLTLMSEEKLDYDLLVWAAGIKANGIDTAQPLPADRKGRLPVDEFLRVKGFANLFAVGDMAAVLRPDGSLVPASAQDGESQGNYLAAALPLLLQNRRPKPYVSKPHGFIVALGGKWGILSYNGIYLTGFLAWLADQLAHLRYYAGIVGWWRAVKYIVFQMEIYGRND
ncbi:MAG TPA: NAD(P)/FAD-dependent oxidoreductase [Patescibacteria group bacterium]|nr:NAD(P)/FAD-dependent oxidoreductase [Patescibacteria group bacterium]